MKNCFLKCSGVTKQRYRILEKIEGMGWYDII